MGMQKTIKLNMHTTEDLWPYQVVDEIQKVMEEGVKKYPKDEGWAVSVYEHLERAHDHLALARESRECRVFESEDHLAHAFTRLMMAIAIERGYIDA